MLHVYWMNKWASSWRTIMTWSYQEWRERMGKARGNCFMEMEIMAVRYYEMFVTSALSLACHWVYHPACPHALKIPAEPNNQRESSVQVLQRGWTHLKREGFLQDWKGSGASWVCVRWAAGFLSSKLILKLKSPLSHFSKPYLFFFFNGRQTGISYFFHQTNAKMT